MTEPKIKIMPLVDSTMFRQSILNHFDGLRQTSVVATGDVSPVHSSSGIGNKSPIAPTVTGQGLSLSPDQPPAVANHDDDREEGEYIADGDENRALSAEPKIQHTRRDNFALRFSFKHRSPVFGLVDDELVNDNSTHRLEPPKADNSSSSSSEWRGFPTLSADTDTDAAAAAEGTDATAVEQRSLLSGIPAADSRRRRADPVNTIPRYPRAQQTTAAAAAAAAAASCPPVSGTKRTVSAVDAAAVGGGTSAPTITNTATANPDHSGHPTPKRRRIAPSHPEAAAWFRKYEEASFHYKTMETKRDTCKKEAMENKASTEAAVLQLTELAKVKDAQERRHREEMEASNKERRAELQEVKRVHSVAMDAVVARIVQADRTVLLREHQLKLAAEANAKYEAVVADLKRQLEASEKKRLAAEADKRQALYNWAIMNSKIAAGHPQQQQQ